MKAFSFGCGGVLVGFFIVGVLVISALDNAIDDGLPAPALGDASGEVTVYVTGNAGAFSGSIGSLGSQRSVDGTTPATFTIDAEVGRATAVIQKRSASGLLSVMLDGCRDGRHEQSTTAAYGVVSVSC